MGRAEYQAELESHWELFKDAGIVEEVRYFAPVMTAGVLSWPTGTRVDAIRHGDGVQKVERDTPAGKVIVETLNWTLRRSQVDSVVKRGKVVDEDGETWLIDASPLRDAGDKTVWQFDTVRL